MPEITYDHRLIIEYRDQNGMKEYDQALDFLREAIREHDERQLPVDAEYLINHPLHGENMIDDEWPLDITSSGVSLYRQSDGSYYDVDRELSLPVKTVKQLDALIDLFGLRIVGGGE